MKTYKKILSLLLAVMMLITTVPLTASAATYGDLSYYVSNGEVTITDCSTTATEVVIPETINGYPVTSIGYQAFDSCKSLEIITIPDSVTSIDSRAFINCTSLTSIVIPDGVTSIKDRTFYGCEGLESITIPDSVTSIGDYAFYHCMSLTSVTIPEDVTSIGQQAFFFCKNLKSINIPDGVTSIAYCAFYWCENLVSITIPDSVTSIATQAFNSCHTLTSLTIPGSVESIDSEAFVGCISLTDITILNPECSIYDSAKTFYSGATIYGYPGSTAQAYAEKYDRTFVALEEDNSEEILNALRYEINDGKITITDCDESFAGDMVIPDTINGYPVTSIGDDAFHYCESLVSITIPNSVTSIGNGAFYECTSLESVTIENSVTSIGWYAFDSCESLTSITIPDSVTSIGGYAFYYCDSLTSITIPDSVTSIGSCAFRECTSLESIIVDENNEKYSSDEYGVLFNKEKTELIQYPISNTRTEYVIPDSVTHIGLDAFSDCGRLESVTIPDSVTSIGSYAFTYCSSLESVTIPDSVTSISYEAFCGCSSLTSIIILNPECEIYDSSSAIYSDATIYGYPGSTAQAYAEKYDRTFVALEEDNSEEILNALSYEINDGEVTITDCDESFAGNMIIPETIEGYPVTRIGEEAFIECGSLESITIPDSVTSIGAFAFGACESLSKATIGNSVTSIGEMAFALCSNLTAINIPDSVTSIGAAAFAYCENLTEAIIPDSVTSIGDEAFALCSKLTEINIPASVTSIGAGVFGGCTSLTNITVDKNNKNYSNDENGVLFNKDKTVLIQYPAGNSNTEYIIPDSVTSIGERAFSNCISLASITIPGSVTSIGDGAFSDCTSLESITIPEEVTYIGSAFSGCTSLKSITIPDNVTAIDDELFTNCESLESITIGKGVTYIGYDSFVGCTNLENITILGTIKEDYGGIGDTKYYNDSKNWDNGVLYVSDHIFAVNENEIPETYAIRPGTKSIPNWTFSFCENLKEVIIPESVTCISFGAFGYNLEKMTILNPECEFYEGWAGAVEEGATIYGYPGSTAQAYAEKYDRTFVELEEDDSEQIFNGLSYEINDGEVTITACDTSFAGDMVIPETINGYPVTSIGQNAFNSCYSLTSITIPDSVTSIGTGAFQATGITSINIPESVEDIGLMAFVYCPNLSSVTVDSDNMYYTSSDDILYSKDMTTLYLCPMQKSGDFVISETVTTIGPAAFYYCYNLTSISIPDSVTRIDPMAFYSCINFKSVTIPDNVTSIELGTFYNCTDLESITIPKNVTRIDEMAFSDCTSLTDVYYSGNEEEWNAITISATENEALLNAEIHFNYCLHENTEKIPAVDATCTETGLTEGKKCSDCGVILVEQTEIPAPGHNVVVVTGVEATCTETGLTDGRFCSVCEEVIEAQETIDALGHDWNVITDTYKECNRCGETDGVLVYDTSVTLSQVTGRPGETVEVYVSFNDAADVKTMSISGIVYDASKLTLVKGEWLAEDSIIANWDQNKKAGVITFAENTTLNGNVFVLTFEIKENLEDCEVEIDCDFGIKAMNENNVETALTVEVIPGSVKITNIIKGDVNGDDYVDSNDAIHLLYNTMLPDMYEVNQDCDFDGNGYVDSNDAIYLLYYTMLPDIYPLA